MTTCPNCGTQYGPNVRICTHDGTVLETDLDAQQIDQVLDGKYRLDAFLSRGGMGAVYRATHILLGKAVALKVIKPELVTSPEVVRRFQREARAATHLNHPNIVAVHDLGQTPDGTLYIVMELVDGPSLRDVIRQAGPMHPARVASILRQVLGALAVAHRNNIIHRDLKPHNIMLARDADGTQTAKLVDFGIAKTFEVDAGTQLTATGATLGTPQYMSPEQITGKEVDGRSDLYSVGIILYEMLTGDVPFNDATTTAILMKHVSEAPPPLSKRMGNLAHAPALEAITLRCLEKDPAKRFQNATELSAALGAAVEGALSEVDLEPTMLAPGSSSGLTHSGNVGGTPTPIGADRVSDPRSMKTMTAPISRAIQPVPYEAGALAPLSPTTALVSAAAPPVRRKSSAATIAAVAALLLIVGAASIWMAFSGGGTAVDESMSATARAEIDQKAAVVTQPAAPTQAPVAQAPGDSSPRPAEAGAIIPTGGENPASTKDQQHAANPAPPAGQPSRAPNNTKAPLEIAATPTAGTDTSASAPRDRQASVPEQAARPSAVAAQPAAAPSELPQDPSVLVRCGGASEVCAAVRTAFDEALEKAGLASVRNPERADVIVDVNASALDERVEQQFGTTFAVRTYSIELDSQTRAGDTITMPPARTISADMRFGRERIAEQARAIAIAAIEKVRAFGAKQKKH